MANDTKEKDPNNTRVKPLKDATPNDRPKIGGAPKITERPNGTVRKDY